MVEPTKDIACILIVDDEPVVLESLRFAFEGHPVEVVGAATARAAQGFIESVEVDCALIDKNLPDGSGLELIEKMRQDRPHAACIMMTGYASMDSAIAAMRLGAVDYLEKPFENLKLVVEKVLSAVRHSHLERERKELFEQLQSFKVELSERNVQLAEARNDLGLFNMLLEERVKDATMELTRELDTVRAGLGTVSLPAALLSETEELIRYARVVPLDDGDAIGVARAFMSRVARKLESYLELLRAASRDDA